MISYAELRRMVLKILESGVASQYIQLRQGVEKMLSTAPLHSPVKENLEQIFWDLVYERILTLGTGGSDPSFPFFRLTEYGREFIQNTKPHFYDSTEYIKILKGLVPQLDKIIVQYIDEALRCYQKNLFFGAAVMAGAASERVILLLLEAILGWETNATKQKKIVSLLERPNLPKIFATINLTINQLINNKLMPYSVHEGSSEHLLSFYEMIRVQRNEAVHPQAGHVSRNKIFLSLQTFPSGLQVIERMRKWFEKNSNLKNP